MTIASSSSRWGRPSPRRARPIYRRSGRAARTIAKNLNGYKLIVQKSTVPVGTGEQVWKIIESNRPRKTAVRRRVQPGVPSRGVGRRGLHASRIASSSAPGRRRPRRSWPEIYRPLYLNETPMVRTNVQTAELIKYASNAFLATKISFINEIANLCEVVGGGREGRRAGHGSRQADRTRSSSTPAPDTAAPASRRTRSPLPRSRREAGSPCEIVEATIEVNHGQRERMLEKIVASAGGNVRGKRDRRARARLQAADRRRPRVGRDRSDPRASTEGRDDLAPSTRSR